MLATLRSVTFGAGCARATQLEATQRVTAHGARRLPVHALLPIEELDRPSAALGDRIERHPTPHGEIPVALVDRMLRDTQAGAPGSRGRGTESPSR